MTTIFVLVFIYLLLEITEGAPHKTTKRRLTRELTNPQVEEDPRFSYALPLTLAASTHATYSNYIYYLLLIWFISYQYFPIPKPPEFLESPLIQQMCTRFVTLLVIASKRTTYLPPPLSHMELPSRVDSCSATTTCSRFHEESPFSSPQPKMRHPLGTWDYPSGSAAIAQHFDGCQCVADVISSAASTWNRHVTDVVTHYWDGMSIWIT